MLLLGTGRSDRGHLCPGQTEPVMPRIQPFEAVQKNPDLSSANSAAAPGHVRLSDQLRKPAGHPLRCAPGGLRTPTQLPQSRRGNVISNEMRSRVVSDVSYAKGLDLAVFLKLSGKFEGIARDVLKDVQPAAEHDPPSGVGEDGPIMDSSVEDDVDVDAGDRGSLRDFQQQFELLAELVWSLGVLRGNEPDIHFVGRVFGGRDALDKFHEITGLVELPDVRISYGDLRGSAQVRYEEGLEGDPTLVLLELLVTLKQRFYGDRLGRNLLTVFRRSSGVPGWIARCVLRVSAYAALTVVVRRVLVLFKSRD
jgi:hypothetical protein